MMESKNQNKIYPIIERFYRIFTYRKNSEKKTIIPKKEEIQVQKIYLRNTIFSNENENIVKKMIIIKYSYKNDIISLNISYNEYSDIFDYNSLF